MLGQTNPDRNSISNGIISLILSSEYCATDDPFVAHPKNQTAAYGEAVNFECRVSSCNHALMFLVNGKGLDHLNVSELYYRKWNVTCDQQSQQVAKLSIIVNNRTLKKVQYVSCNLTQFTNGRLHVTSSNKAYIHGINQYCSQLPTTRAHLQDENPAVTEHASFNTASKEKLSVTVQFVTIITTSVLHLTL